MSMKEKGNLKTGSPTMHTTGTKDFVEILPKTKVEDRRIP